MNNLLFTLMNASNLVRRVAALTLLLFVAMIPLSIAAMAAYNVSDLAKNIDTQRLSLGHLTAFISNSAKAAESSPPSSSASAGDLFLAGATAAIAQANLQTLVTDIARKENVEVASTSGLPLLESGRLRLAGIRLSLQGGLAPMYGAIKQIELATPPLVIREVSIRNVTPIQSSVLSGPIQLSAELSVYGSISPATTIEGGVAK
ncbi:type II secretion system protein GspM [Rhizobium sp. SG741]|uniref:type II secretion system protein GspM n=1 Tax=Rhizobium sp. SG741 TaxID=2587114 RepID=UPI001446E5C5|nr:type II secretion system protein GspM [Rhizobium sp. SG741]NKJ08999.1 hypothetical protein [Rhizobium sp. SG741]